jgi:hypothetical protein
MGLSSGSARPDGAESGQGSKGGGVVSRMAGVFTAPKQAFGEIARKAAEPEPSKASGFADRSRWWIPLLVFVVVMIVVSAMTLPTLVLPEQMEAQRALLLERGMSPEEIDRAMVIGEKAALPAAIVSTAVGSVIVAFLIAAILHMFMKIFGGKGRYKQALAAFSYSPLIPALGSLIKLPMMLARKTMYVETGPALFFPNLEPSDAMYRFLSGLDVFTLWQLAVLSIGLAVAYKVSTAKAGIVLVALWLIFLFVASRFLPQGGAFGV